MTNGNSQKDCNIYYLDEKDKQRILSILEDKTPPSREVIDRLKRANEKYKVNRKY